MGRDSSALCKSGIDEACLFGVLDRVRKRKAASQICVMRDGEVVLDQSFGCEKDSLFWIFSASKPFMAMLIYLLAERDQVQLDEPVATYWPEFAQCGKAAITIRDVLKHRSGLVQSRGIGDALAMSDWKAFTNRIAQSRPTLMPGDGPAYQTLSYGFILGEIIQRVTQRPVREVLNVELLNSLAMGNTFLGLPNELWERHVPVSGRGIYGRLGAWFVNQRAVRESVNPSAGISTTAADMAAFYQMLLSGGVAGDRHILRMSSIEEARTPSCGEEFDRCARKPIRWAQGFELGGPRSDHRFISAMGSKSSPLTFGHNGSDCCIAWADPTRRIAFAYLTNRLSAGKETVEHLAGVADAILAAYR